MRFRTIFGGKIPHSALLVISLVTVFVIFCFYKSLSLNKGISTDQEDENSYKKWKKIDSILDIRNNNYILNYHYEHRPKVTYFHDLANSSWQMGTYYIAAEMARRYKATHIIDLGCGKAGKLDILSREFQTIGIDFEANIKAARKSYPSLKFVEFDMSLTSCKLEIDEQVLRNSVVVSADVIEHLQDPLDCYVKILKRWSEHVKATVVSTPDRKFVSVNTPNGPPYNPSHIREWTLPELELLFVDQGFSVVLSGVTCNFPGNCQSGFFPAKNDQATMTLTMENNKLAEKSNEQSASSSLIVYLVVHQKTKRSIVHQNFDYLSQLNVKQIVLLVPSNSKSDFKFFQQIIPYKTAEHIKDLIKDYSANHNGWNVLLDSHEFIYVTRQAGEKFDLANYLQKASIQGFNSVPVTTSFASKNKEFPFWLHISKSWNNSPKEISSFASPQQMFKVKIWFGNPTDLEFESNKSKRADDIVRNVRFSQQEVYPYGLFTVRHSPDEEIIVNSFEDFASNSYQRMYSYTFALGYLEWDKRRMLQTDLLY